MTVTNLTPPVISGTAIQGRTLVSTEGTWDFDLDYLDYAYQWLRCDAAGANCGDIVGATSASYVLQLADVGKRLRSEVTATEVAYPSGGLGELTWPPPTAGAGGVEIVNFTLTNATRQSSLLGLGAGRDLVITNTEILTGPVYQFNNWRNVIWIGGEMNIASGTGVVTGVALRNITGIFHMEGVHIHGAAGPHDVFVIRSPDTSSGCIVQIQYCRLEAQEHASEHADCIQFQQAKCNGLRLDKVTLYSELQHSFMRVGGSAVDYAKNISLKRTNYRGTGTNTLWQNWENGDSTTSLKQIVPIVLDDVWVAEDGDTSSVGMRVIPRSDFYSGAGSAAPGYGGSTQWSGSRRGCFVATDGISQYCSFSDGTQLVPTGASTGQQTLDCQIDGIIRKGIPPGGDFAPDGVPGISYVSPGYL